MAKQNPTQTAARSAAPAGKGSAPGPKREVRTSAPTPAKPAVTPSPAGRGGVPVARPAAEGTSRFAGVQRGFRETAAELRKVQWPDRLTTRNLTLVVIGMSAVLALVLGGVDLVLTRVIEWLISLPIGG